MLAFSNDNASMGAITGLRPRHRHPHPLRHRHSRGVPGRAPSPSSPPATIPPITRAPHAPSPGSPTPAATSAVVTSSIRLTAINDRPVLSAGGSLAYTENAAAVDPALSITDPDDSRFGAAAIAIQSPVSENVLAFSNDNASMGAITGSYDPATGILTLSGTATAAEYQAALRSVAFFSTSKDPTADHTRTSRTISWQITDAGSDAAGTATSAVVTSSISLTAINDRPVLSAGGSLAYTENGAGSGH